MKQTDYEKKPAPGQIVHVVIDRPMNTYHPEHKDLFYPVNYGYIEGIIAPDGEEQDVYVLGVDHPGKRNLLVKSLLLSTVLMMWKINGWQYRKI